MRLSLIQRFYERSQLLLELNRYSERLGFDSALFLVSIVSSTKSGSLSSRFVFGTSIAIREENFNERMFVLGCNQSQVRIQSWISNSQSIRVAILVHKSNCFISNISCKMFDYESFRSFGHRIELMRREWRIKFVQQSIVASSGNHTFLIENCCKLRW